MGAVKFLNHHRLMWYSKTPAGQKWIVRVCLLLMGMLDIVEGIVVKKENRPLIIRYIVIAVVIFWVSVWLSIVTRMLRGISPAAGGFSNAQGQGCFGISPQRGEKDHLN